MATLQPGGLINRFNTFSISYILIQFFLSWQQKKKSNNAIETSKRNSSLFSSMAHMTFGLLSVLFCRVALPLSSEEVTAFLPPHFPFPFFLSLLLLPLLFKHILNYIFAFLACVSVCGGVRGSQKTTVGESCLPHGSW